MYDLTALKKDFLVMGMRSGYKTGGPPASFWFTMSDCNTNGTTMPQTRWVTVGEEVPRKRWRALWYRPSSNKTFRFDDTTLAPIECTSTPILFETV